METLVCIALLVDARIHDDSLRNDRVGRSDLERTLQKSYDPPDGNHDEDGDDAPKHDLEALVRIFRAHAPQVFDQTPEEDNDSERNKKADNAVQKGAHENERVCKRGGRSDHRDKGSYDRQRRENGNS